MYAWARDNYAINHFILFSYLFFSDLQFPIDLSCVEKDHPFLMKDQLQSLYRRLLVLNRSAAMRLDGQYNRNVNVCCKKNIKDINLSPPLSFSLASDASPCGALFFGGPISWLMISIYAQCFFIVVAHAYWDGVPISFIYIWNYDDDYYDVAKTAWWKWIKSLDEPLNHEDGSIKYH